VTAAAAGDLIAYVEADIRFHLGLLALAGNAHLVEVVGELRKRSRLYGLHALVAADRLRDSAEEHLELLDALLARDERAVREVMTRHLGHVRGLWAAPGAGQGTVPGAASEAASGAARAARASRA
jgi:DNA-binding GntR family transcriptional regulator